MGIPITYKEASANAYGDAAYVADRTTADAVGLSAKINDKRDLNGDTTVFVQARMSTAAATVAVTVVLYSERGTALLGIAPPGTQTATATSYREQNATGDYYTQILAFDACGATQYEVRMAAPSAGSADLYTWSA